MDQRRKRDSFSKTFRNGKSSKANQSSLIDKEHEFGEISQEARNRRESQTSRQDSQEKVTIRYNRSQSYDSNRRSQSQNCRTGEFYWECSDSRSRRGQHDRNQSRDGGQSHQGESKERKSALLACVAFVRREGSNWITQV